jgi:hypothetical protein
MGMHDELYCDAELPDDAVPAGAVFETKAFPYPFLYRYRITKAGRLIDALGRDLECEGYLEFYYYLERSVENYRLAEYRAHFCRGQLNDIVRVVEPEVVDARVIYGLAKYLIFANAALSSFMSEDVETPEETEAPASGRSAEASERRAALGVFLDDWEKDHGPITSVELDRAGKELK